MIGRNQFGSYLYHRRSPQLFEDHGVPVYTTPGIDHYLTYAGIIETRRGQVSAAVTPPFGAPLPPVPMVAPRPATWRSPAHAIAIAQGSNVGLTGFPSIGSGKCGCGGK